MLLKYNPINTKKWYTYWIKNKFFLPDYNLEKKYCITIPPPNVTGNLHMGHAFQSTLMDILIRFYRMNKYSTLWKVGTDHAGIATQITVENKLKINNISKKSLGREKFIKHVLLWKKTSVKNIRSQLKELGCSINWNTERFTMDKNFSYAVKTAFIQLYEEGLIYKDKKLVNWDPVLKTAISDLETIYEKKTSKLYYIKYHSVSDNKKYIIVATTRPETLFGDEAIAINPNDNRYKNIHNIKFQIPLTKKNIPIIKDDSIDINFGTGCVKITPGHDFKDFDLAKKHNLNIKNILTKEAKLNNNVPDKYVGLDINTARKIILEDLNKQNLIEKIEDHESNIPKGDRSNSIIEPLITEQWYVNIKPLSKLVINALNKKEIKIIPKKWEKTFFIWIDNIKDWCISRQIWWGHKIPIWYDKKNNIYTGFNEKNIIKKYNLEKKIILKQDTNVLDTWFSSALWPFASLGWPKKMKEINTFYPTNTLITGFDIIFFWAIRMIMFGIKFTKQIPFKEIYIHGLIRDDSGNKMSKTKGNVIDPMDIINGITYKDLIKKRISENMNREKNILIENKTKKQFSNGIPSYGADALRFTFCTLATDNISINLNLDKIESYKKFCNKLWHASRFVFLYKKTNIDSNNKKSIYDYWIISLWENTKKEIYENIINRNFAIFSNIIYKFTWDEYCNWYIEFSKILLNTKLYNISTINTLNTILKELLKTLHPIIPFITEDIWQKINNNNTSIMKETYPLYNKKNLIKQNYKIINFIKELIICIRNLQSNSNIKKNDYIKIIIKNIKKDNLIYLEKTKYILIKLLGINNIYISNKEIDIKNYNNIITLDNICIYIYTKNKNEIQIDSNIKIKTIDKEIEKTKKLLKNNTFLTKADKLIIENKKTKLKNLLITKKKIKL